MLMDRAITHIWTRATRWAVAAVIGAAMTTIGCVPPAGVQQKHLRQPIVAIDVADPLTVSAKY
jgi:hypothetical protein